MLFRYSLAIADFVRIVRLPRACRDASDADRMLAEFFTGHPILRIDALDSTGHEPAPSSCPEVRLSRMRFQPRLLPPIERAMTHTGSYATSMIEP